MKEQSKETVIKVLGIDLAKRSFHLYGENGSSAHFRTELHGLAEELRHLNERVAHYDTQINAIAQGDHQARDLTTIPGIGGKGATALLAAVDVDATLVPQWSRARCLERSGAASAFHGWA